MRKEKIMLLKLINNISKLSCYDPDGAFYLFINIKKYSNDSMKFCAHLLEGKGVALVPGLAFGMEGYVRLSFATSMKAIEDGINRIKEFVEK